MPALAQYPLLLSLQQLAREKKTDVFLVGGFLRDLTLGCPGHDFDFALKKGAIAFAKSFAARIKGAFVLLDQERGCARVVKKFQGMIETYDFSDFRAQTLQKDLKLRDFSVNALFLKINGLSPEENFVSQIKDPCAGQKDLKAKAIRMISPQAFVDDPLRLLRAYSLQAKYGFKIEARTLKQIKKDKDLLPNVSRERILDELYKILESDRTASVLRAMDQAGVFVNVIPQVEVMFGVKQGGYHHLDVWKHSLETVAQVENVLCEFQTHEDIAGYVNQPLAGERRRRGLLKLAALLHDIGKPQTRKKEKDRMTFHGHEHVGKGMVRQIAKMLKLSSKERMALEDMVLWHLRPGYLSNFKKPSERMYFRYFRDTKEEAAAIALLAMADQRSTRGPLTTEQDQKHHDKICREILRRFFAAKKETPLVRLLDGHDLIKKLKLQPSPLFGRILKEVEEAQAMGKITDADEALKFARKIVKGKD